MNRLLTKAFFIGVFGDLLLQLAVKKEGDVAGLKNYFLQHGIMESAMIAGGLMFLITWFYLQLNLPLSVIPLFIYGGILDVLWRRCNLMPSLGPTYYKNMAPFWSFVWGGIPMLLLLIGEKEIRLL